MYNNIILKYHLWYLRQMSLQIMLITYTNTRRYELNKLTSLPMCGFIAQLVEQRTGNAEVTGSNPVEALIVFSDLFFPTV